MDGMPEYPFIDSRYDDLRELDELRNFVEALKAWGLQHKVERVFYDTKSNLCEISICEGIDDRTVDFIYVLADEHIGQYLRNRRVCHGKPMADWYGPNIAWRDGDTMFDPDRDPSGSLLPRNCPEGRDTLEGTVAEDGSARVQALHAGKGETTAAQQRALAGLEGESALAAWFAREGLPYVAICQQPGTFASLFTGSVKRPDFLLLFDALGMIGVDVKNISPSEWNGRLFYSLSLDDELRRAIAFERVFRMPVWYAIKGRDEWLWISALKAVEAGRTLQNSTTKANFVSIGKQHFVHVRTGDDLAGLYSQRIPGYRRVAALSA